MKFKQAEGQEEKALCGWHIWGEMTTTSVFRSHRSGFCGRTFKEISFIASIAPKALEFPRDCLIWWFWCCYPQARPLSLDSLGAMQGRGARSQGCQDPGPRRCRLAGEGAQGPRTPRSEHTVVHITAALVHSNRARCLFHEGFCQREQPEGCCQLHRNKVKECSSSPPDP